MSSDNSTQTRRAILQKSVLAAGSISLGATALTGSATADQPEIADLEGLVIENPCTEETLTATRGKGRLDVDEREDQSGGFHGKFKLLLNATFEGEKTGRMYQGSLEASRMIYVSADEVPTTQTSVFREKIISRGPVDNFVAKALVHLTVSADGVEAVNMEMESEECL